MANTNPAFMSGVPELLVLRILSDTEMYGYELVRAIRICSAERIALAEGVVYPALHSLESRGLLKSRRRAVDGRNRIYYRTTAKGIKRLNSIVDDWQRISAGINDILGGQHA
ncbi:MAG: helix-turn-helix transcriptional regulator [Pseudomonadales bacterium]|nr:helix-turn-helix transcriptional regulator [Pseudomonadales bacterium]